MKKKVIGHQHQQYVTPQCEAYDVLNNTMLSDSITSITTPGIEDKGTETLEEETFDWSTSKLSNLLDF